MGKLIDITGVKFGRLTVVAIAPTDPSRSKKSRRQWLAKCECGASGKFDSADLRTGKTRSCGCLRSQLAMIRCLKKSNRPIEGAKRQTKEEKKAHKRAYQKEYYQKKLIGKPVSEQRRQYMSQFRSGPYRRGYAQKYNSILNNRVAKNLRDRLRIAVKRSLSKKSGSALDNLGCSVPELISYLGQRFQPGMSWDNWGEWHIDHIKPLSRFDLSEPTQLATACHFTNLQPLWAHDNLSKGGR